MKEYMQKNNKYILISSVILIVIWNVAYELIQNSVILPSPRETFISLVEIIKSSDFFVILKNTMFRGIYSFIIALIIAIIIGLLSSINKILYNFMIPIISCLKFIPNIAIVVLALIWLDNEKAPVLMSVLVLFPLFYESIIKGIKSIDKNILEMVFIYKMSLLDIIMHIYIPNVFMSIFKVISSAFGLCLKIIIAGEILGQPQNSMGTSIQLEKMYLNTNNVFAWIIILVFISLLIDYLNNKIFKYLTLKGMIKYE